MRLTIRSFHFPRISEYETKSLAWKITFFAIISPPLLFNIQPYIPFAAFTRRCGCTGLGRAELGWRGMISIGMTSIRIHQAATPAQPLCLDARARFPAQAARVTEFLRGALMCLCIWPAHGPVPVDTGVCAL